VESLLHISLVVYPVEERSVKDSFIVPEEFGASRWGKASRQKGFNLT
jgi:hypothetical protein